MAFSGLITGVPVTMEGVKVGTAEISADGTCYIRFDRENMQYAELMAEFLSCGLADGISISSNTVPAVDTHAYRTDRPSPTKK